MLGNFWLQPLAQCDGAGHSIQKACTLWSARKCMIRKNILKFFKFTVLAFVSFFVLPNISLAFAECSLSVVGGCTSGNIGNCYGGIIYPKDSVFVGITGNLTATNSSGYQVYLKSTSSSLSYTFPLLKTSNDKQFRTGGPVIVAKGDYTASFVSGGSPVCTGTVAVSAPYNPDEDVPTAGDGSGPGGGAATPTGTTQNPVGSGTTQVSGGAVGEGLKQLGGIFPSTGFGATNSIGGLIIGVIKFLMGLLFAVAVLMLIIGGFMYVTAAGSEDRAKMGRRTITYALIGMSVAILAYVIVSVVDSAVSTASPIG